MKYLLARAIRGLRAALEDALPGRSCDPRQCGTCDRVVTKLSPDQVAEVASKRMPVCRRGGCRGWLWWVEDLASLRAQAQAESGVAR